MAVSGSFSQILLDPGCGKVQPLCEILGYGSEAKENPRSVFKLSKKTINFRKKFVSESSNLSQFPLDYTSEVVQRCATAFLQHHSMMFTDSNNTYSPSWPALPGDRVLLRNTIAKLMCAQEFIYRRNIIYAESRKQCMTRESTPDSDIVDSDDDIIEVLHEEIQSGDGSNNAQVNSGLTRFAIQRNTQIHLNFCYPMVKSRQGEGVNTSWIHLKSEPWPPAVKQFAFRYLHDRNLYSARKSASADVDQFVADLTGFLGLKEVQSVTDSEIRRRCRGLISTSAGKWGSSGYGFLVENPSGKLVKSPEFENTWKLRRDEWIWAIHRGNVEDVSEIVNVLMRGQQGESNIHSLKRRLTGDQPYTAADGEDFEPKTIDGSKRQKFGTTSSDRLPSTDTTPENNCVSDSIECFNDMQQKRATPSTSNQPGCGGITTVATPTSHIYTQPHTNKKPHGNYQKHFVSSEQASAELFDHPSLSTMGDLASNARSASLSELYHAQMTTGAPQKKTSPQSNTEMSEANIITSHTTPLDGTATPVHPMPQAPAAISAPVAMAPGRSMLEFVLEDSDGIPDYELSSIVSSAVFKASTHASFFSLIAARRAVPLETIQSILLRCSWGDRISFVVGHNDEEDTWRNVQRRVGRKFLWDKENLANVREWRVTTRAIFVTNYVGVTEQQALDGEDAW